ncbi:MAG: pteridine reductase [Proteobacteria bacterium]|nr:pteridine reductase [Pseudomonadota bacterium]MBT6349723.1 pteridine reductase [Pseudomonadota bacterium]
MPGTEHSLDSKVALITGGARRIGAAIARTLHAEGMNLIIHYRNSGDNAKTLADELNQHRSGSVALAKADLEKTEDCSRLAQQAIDAFGRIHALINNASAFFPTPLGEISQKHWETLLGVNLKAPFFLSQACAEALTSTQGAIINLTDIYAKRPLPKHLVYSVSKAGLVALTHSLAQELGPDVRVNAIAPGAILWPESGDTQENQEEIIRRTPLGRLGDPGDIAGTVLFLLRDAPFITGQVINVDGGRSVRP